MALTERLAIVLEAVGGGVVASEFAKVGASAEKEYAKVQRAQAATGQSTGALGGVLQKFGLDGAAGVAAVGIGVAAAGTAVLKFGADSIHAFADATAQVRAYQRVTGDSAEESSKMVAAMKVLGVDSEAAGKAMARLGRSISDGNDKLGEFGISVAKNKDGTTNLGATLLNIADKYKQTGDAARRNAIALDLFGKQGTTLIPILARGRDGLQELFKEAERHHQIFGPEDLEKGRQFNLALESMKQSFTGIEIEAGRALVPFITDVAKATEETIQFFDKLKDHAGFLKQLGYNLGLQNDPKDLPEKLQKLVAAQNAARNSTVDLAAAAKQQAIDIENNDKAVKNLLNDTIANASAQKAEQNAKQGVLDAQGRLTEAVKAYNDLKKKGAVDEQAVADAEKSLTQAHRNLVTATEAVTRAQQDLNDLLHPAARTLTDAQLDIADAARQQQRAVLAVTDAQNALADAQGAVAKAQEDLNAAQASGNQASILAATKALAEAQANAPEAIAKAQIDLADAIDNVTRTNERASDAQQAYNDLLHPELTTAYKDAQQKLATAQQGVKDATDAQNEAAQKLRTAQAGDPKFADDLAAAQRGVDAAQRGVADANDALSTAAFNAARAQQQLNSDMTDSVNVSGQYAANLAAIVALDQQAAGYAGLLGYNGANPTGTPGNYAGIDAGTTFRPRAAGGPFNAGDTLTVGEFGPEELHMNGPGSISPNSRGRGMTVVVQVAGSVVTERDLIDVVHAGLQEKQNRSGPLHLN